MTAQLCRELSPIKSRQPDPVYCHRPLDHEGWHEGRLQKTRERLAWPQESAS